MRTRLALLGAIFSLSAPTASAQNIIFLPDYSLEGPLEGFNATTPLVPYNGGTPIPIGQARRQSFEASLNIMGSLLQRRYVGETIVVQAQFNPLGGGENEATLASAGTNGFVGGFAGAPMANTFYPQPLVNHRFGSDQNGAAHEIEITFNSDVDNPTVLGPTSWHYGDNRTPGSNEDLVSTSLHELGHGLGFASLLLASGAYNGANPAVWDRFNNTSSTAGTKLPDLATDALRQAERTGNDLWWDGANGTFFNSGTRPRLYAPNPFESGSSLSHTDETTHNLDLMSPASDGVADYSFMNRGMLQDMGWMVTPIPEPTCLLVLSLIAGGVMRRRLR